MSDQTSVSNLRQYRFKKDAMKASPGNAGYKNFSTSIPHSFYEHLVCVCVCEKAYMKLFSIDLWTIFRVSLDSEYKLVPGRKRIHAPADSSSDEGQNSPKKQPTLTVKEKEARLITLRHSEPDYDTMVSIRYTIKICPVNTNSIVRSVRMPYTKITGTSKLPLNIYTKNVQRNHVPKEPERISYFQS